MPYLYRNAIETSRTGVPVMRSMVLEYTKDRTCAYLDKQYMFGDSLLVAPIFNEDSKAIYYLPEGNWTHYLTGEKKAGGKWYEEDCGYLSIPVFAKENSLIAVGAETARPDYDYAQDVTIKAYCLKEGVPASTVVYGMDKNAETVVSVKKENGKINIHIEAEKPCKVVLVDETVAKVDGASWEMQGADCVVSFEKGGDVVCE